MKLCLDFPDVCIAFTGTTLLCFNFTLLLDLNIRCEPGDWTYVAQNMESRGGLF